MELKSERIKVRDLGVLYTPPDKSGSGSFALRVGSGSYAPATTSCVRSLVGVTKSDFTVLKEVFDNQKLNDAVLEYLCGKSACEEIVLHRSRGAVTDVSSPGSVKIGPQKAFEITRETLGRDSPGVSFVSYTPNKNKFEFMALTSHFEHPRRKVGEISHAGVSVEINGSALVRPSVFTLACMNGMVADQGSVEAVQVFSERDVKEGVERSKTLLQRFVALDDVEFANAQDALTIIARELGFSDRMARRVLESASSVFAGRDRVTGYELVNHVTSLAKNGGGLKYSFKGGDMLGLLAKERCSSCGTWK